MGRRHTYRVLFPDARIVGDNSSLLKSLASAGLNVVTTLRDPEIVDVVLTFFHGRNRVTRRIHNLLLKVDCPVVGIEQAEDGDRNDPIAILDFQLNNDTPSPVVAHTVRKIIDASRCEADVQSLEHQVTRFRRQLDDVVDLGIQVTGTLLPHELLDLVAARSHMLVKADLHAVFTYDANRQICHLRARHINGAPSSHRITPTHRLHPDVESALTETTVPVMGTDPFLTPAWMQHLVKNIGALKSVIVAPFHSKEHLIGFLIIGRSCREQAFSPEDMERIEVLSAFSSVAVANAFVYEQTETASQIDNLTRLYHFDHLKKFLDRLLKANESLSLVFLDLDGFKKINVTHGHRAGNEALHAAASLILDCLEPFCMAGRFGGDEFILVMPGTLAEDARESTIGIIQNIEALKIHEDIHLSASAGIAEYPEDGDNLNSLIHAADTAMYTAKGRGRGLTLLYREINEGE